MDKSISLSSTWEIIDAKGVIYSGFTEEETIALFMDDEPDFEWNGDLKLVEIHATRR